MRDRLSDFEQFVRNAGQFTDAPSEPTGGAHPFEQRNILSKLPAKIRKLFDDGHYSEATFEACKFLDKEIQKHSGAKQSGWDLMMHAFAVNGTTAQIQLTPLSNTSEIDEQEGYKFLFGGLSRGIRNPRGHEYNVPDSLDTCLDHLSLVSLLLRRLEDSGYR